MKRARTVWAEALLALTACLWLGARAEPAGAQAICTPRIVGQDTVATPAQRKAASLLVRPASLIDPLNGFAWPDTQLGVVPSLDGKSTLFFGSDGGCHANCDAVFNRYGSITRTVGSLDNPLGAAAPTEALLTSAALKPFDDYVGGGPVFRVPFGREGGGQLLMVYHIERATYFAPYHYPDPVKRQKSFYSSLGLAKSNDEGRTWTDLGEILSANRPYKPDGPPFDIGDGNLVMDPTQTYFYIYFPDSIEHGVANTFMSVARAPIGAVLDAAFGSGSKAAAFVKYDRGRWDQPGRGGRSSSVLPRALSYGGDAQVAFSASLGRYVAILDDTQHISYAESVDGLVWTNTALVLAADPAVASALYAKPVGLTGDSNSVGPRYYILYTNYPSDGTGWAGAEVRRLTIDCAPPGH